MGELINIDDRRRWKRAKNAWEQSSARTSWAMLSDEQRLQFKRDFEAAEERLRSRFEGR